jgi:hypothetical protein
MRDNLGSSWPHWPTRTTEGVTGMWRKSSYSHDEGTDCVEVAWCKPRSTSDGVLVRDSKNPEGPKLTLSATAWQRLLVTR